MESWKGLNFQFFPILPVPSSLTETSLTDNHRDMMQPAITLREQIAGAQTTCGVLLTEHLWSQAVEVVMAAGLDYVIIDAEHLDHGAIQIAEVCAAGRMAAFPVLLRPSASTEAATRAAMDLGPCGFVTIGGECHTAGCCSRSCVAAAAEQSASRRAG